jgi:hypothetical protein
MKKLTRNIDEYLQYGGWSSSLFFNHAKLLFRDKDINRLATFEIGRTVVYLRARGKLFKFYVHYQGRSKEYLTLTDSHGVEIAAYHYTVKTKEIKEKILQLLLE